jgi:hypothetical protein
VPAILILSVNCGLNRPWTSYVAFRCYRTEKQAKRQSVGWLIQMVVCPLSYQDGSLSSPWT